MKHYHEYHGAPDVLSEGMGAFLDYLKANFAPVAAATPQRTPECLFCSATFADASELEQVWLLSCEVDMVLS